MSVAPGTTLGRYEVISPLGAGGMGVVYKARDTRLGRDVAIKVLPPEFSDSAGSLRRFEQEACAASALNHPGILTIYEVGQEDEVRFIATEFIDGQTLRRRMTAAPFPVEEALDVGVQAAAALAAAHEAGIIHRDIKPENIMMRRDGLVKVLDFGLAKLTEPVHTSSIDTEAQTRPLTGTLPGTVLGTVDYMSPEQARGQEVDARTDVWSLGVLLYEMIARRRPFEGTTKSDVMAAILTSEPPPPALDAEEVPEELRRIVMKALRPRREERYQRAGEMLTDLRNLQKDVEFNSKLDRLTGDASLRRTGGRIPSPSRDAAVARRPRARTARLLLLFVPAAALAAVVLWWLAAGRGGDEAKTPPPGSLKQVEVVNWKSAPGEVYSVGSFSPSGEEIAFASTRGGTKGIWIKKTAVGDPTPVTKDEFINDAPVWSPDGREIAYFSNRGGEPGIWRIPAFGGTPVLVKSFDDGSVRPRRWSKNGTIYYESRQSLFALDAATGETRPLASTADAAAGSFSVSPDGRHVAYVRVSGGKNEVWRASADGGEPTLVSRDTTDHRNTAWSADGRRVLYSANVEGAYQIFASSADGGAPAQLTFGEGDSFVLDVSADGSEILYGSSKEESDVWGVNVSGGEEFAFAADLGAELWPAVSPDGKRVAYQSVRRVSQGDKLFAGSILTKTAGDEGAGFELTPNGFLPVWSPDGSSVAFLRVTGDLYSLWTVRAAGGGERQLAAGGLPSVEFTMLPYNRPQTASFSWSPDGSRLVYVSQRTGQRNLWVVGADGAGDARLTHNEDANLHLFCPLWSPDGRRIAYTSKPNRIGAGERAVYRVWVAEGGTGDASEVLRSDAFLRLLGWSRDGEWLALATVEGREWSGAPLEVTVVRANTRTGERRAAATLQSAYLYNIHLSPDGKTIAFVSRRDGKDNVWVAAADRPGEPRRLTANSDPRLYFSSLSWSMDGRAIYFGKQSRHSLLSMIVNFK